jgi:hypothetical protein
MANEQKRGPGRYAHFTDEFKTETARLAETSGCPLRVTAGGSWHWAFDAWQMDLGSTRGGYFVRPPRRHGQGTGTAAQGKRDIAAGARLSKKRNRLLGEEGECANPAGMCAARRSRRIIGWAVSDRPKKDLALTALRRAIAIRRPPKVVSITPIVAANIARTTIKSS